MAHAKPMNRKRDCCSQRFAFGIVHAEPLLKTRSRGFDPTRRATQSPKKGRKTFQKNNPKKLIKFMFLKHVFLYYFMHV
ncbi:hypothetical protein FYW06_27745 [Bacillus paranthracis]|uniref:Uncharacterized protein n=1 Tax=Bacillus paranthracis TaxID=2026186 RepID=A0A5M9GF76_9BACI|nr:hypothetical protein FYW06_27745 [Bacillus paranthracis]